MSLLHIGFMAQRYVFLDGMRGVAALVVLAVHTSSIFELPVLFPNGSLAVDLFFCLSGFVLARAYDSKVRARGFGWLMGRRVMRLYPMIVFAVVISAALAYAEGKAGVPTLSAAALVLFPISLVMGGVLAFPLNLPMWSLFFEMVGSAGYGLERNRLSNRVLLLLVVVSGCVLATTMAVGHVENFGVGGRAAFLVGFPRMIYPFALGVLFARLNLWVPSLADWKLAVVLVAAFAIPIPIALLLPVMVLLGANAVTRSPAVWDWLGRVSYPLYLVHVPILEAARHFMLPWPAAVAASVAVAALTLVLYDEPLRAFLQLRVDRILVRFRL